MSELSEAINEMRTMRESYDQLGAAAEAYNTGKTELAANITAKGVPASADETLPELAEKVNAIQQETIEIDGGEMFETQLYGAPTSVENVGGVYVQNGGSLWNLYEVMAQLLSDGRFVQYGGIMLAEYFKGYDTIELMNAGAGGAYFTCDGDFYTTDKTGENPHVWHDDENGMMNRWVAYLFAAESSNYIIPSESLCPRSIHIGRKVGTIYCASAGRIREIVVTDGNELYGTNFDSTQVWQQEVTLRGIKHNNTKPIINNSRIVTSVIVKDMDITYPILGNNSYSGADKNIAAVAILGNTTITPVANVTYRRAITYLSSATPSYGIFFSYIYIQEGISWGNVGLIHGASITSPSSVGGKLTIAGIKTLKSPIFSMELYGDSDYHKEIVFQDLETTEGGLVKVSSSNGFGAYWETLDMGKCTISSPLNSGTHPGFYLRRLTNFIIGGATTNIYLPYWTCQDVINDADKMAELNANLRTNFIPKLSDGNNTLTFTIASALYAKLEQATLDAFAAKHWLVAGA